MQICLKPNLSASRCFDSYKGSVVAHLNSNIASRIKAKKFYAALTITVYCVTIFLPRNYIVTQFCKVYNFVLRINFFSDKYIFNKVLVYFVVMFFLQLNFSAEFRFRNLLDDMQLQYCIVRYVLLLTGHDRLG